MPSVRTSEMPAGRIIDYAGGPVPDGFLLCDGTSVSVSQYPTLFAAIQYAYGGSGVNFSLPDSLSRSLMGSGTGVGLTPRTRGPATIGSETVTLVANELPSHSHSVGVTVAMAIPDGDGAHGHTIDKSNTSRSGAGGSGRFSSGGNSAEPDDMTLPSDSSDHNHAITPTVTVSETSIGGSNLHTNLQPSLVVTKLIKY